jgi:hypothetical protein
MARLARLRFRRGSVTLVVTSSTLYSEH